MVRQYNEVKAALVQAVSDANAFLSGAQAMSQTLRGYGITLTVPPTVQ
jgi:hypothetical protein